MPGVMFWSVGMTGNYFSSYDRVSSPILDFLPIFDLALNCLLSIDRVSSPRGLEEIEAILFKGGSPFLP